MSFYAVYRGRKTGIYTTWEEARQQVDGYPGACFCKCKNREEANGYMTSGMKLARIIDREDVGKIKPKIIVRPIGPLAPSAPAPSAPTPSAPAPDALDHYFKGFKELFKPQQEPEPDPDIEHDPLKPLIEKYLNSINNADEATIHIYTDGSVFSNGKANAYGGYGVFIRDGKETITKYFPLPRSYS